MRFMDVLNVDSRELTIEDVVDRVQGKGHGCVEEVVFYKADGFYFDSIRLNQEDLVFVYERGVFSDEWLSFSDKRVELESITVGDALKEAGVDHKVDEKELLRKD